MEQWKDEYRDLESRSSASESTTFLGVPKPKATTSPRGYLRHVRTLLELVLVSTLVVLFSTGSVHIPHSKVKKYGPTIQRKEVILGNTAGFGPEIIYNNHEMLWNKTEMSRVHRNWQQLFPKGRGYVRVQPGDDFEVLHPPFVMVDTLVEGDRYEGYIMAVYHQLHCLSILTTSMGTSHAEWRAMDPKIVEHRSHCVEYLRQSILCNGDTTLEGETGSWTKSTGWGQTHSCVNFEAMTDWADKRGIWDLSEELLPMSFDPLKVDVGKDGEDGKDEEGDEG